FWRKKLGASDEDEKRNEDGGTSGEQNPEVEFPKTLCKAIASITAGFSFAYIQEAFVASLLAIAANEGEAADAGGSEVEVEAHKVAASIPWEGRWDTGDQDRDLDRFILWREMKKQVKILREELDEGGEENEIVISY
ncbi:MAG: hypothetical protein L6R42_009355, partial [Xanthoria sp. 1 TBL-2021]